MQVRVMYGLTSVRGLFGNAIAAYAIHRTTTTFFGVAVMPQHTRRGLAPIALPANAQRQLQCSYALLTQVYVLATHAVGFALHAPHRCTVGVVIALLRGARQRAWQ